MASALDGRNDASTSDDGSRGVYGISVTSELSGIGLQTLRLYERRGLVTPTRTSGGTRRYSQKDIRQLSRIAELVEEGVNLTGIRRILVLEDETAQLRKEIAGLQGGEGATSS